MLSRWIGQRTVANDDRPGQTSAVVPLLVNVRVVDEGPAPRRSESGLERVARRDERRELLIGAREARHSVEVALELDAVPMHRERLADAVHDGDRHGLSARELDARAEAR